MILAVASSVYFALVILFGVTAAVALALAYFLLCAKQAVERIAREADAAAREARRSAEAEEAEGSIFETSVADKHRTLEKAHRLYAYRLNQVFTRETICPTVK